ncbi:MAG TPA: D-2-hydroxyacid dehydrogenase [Chloroflexota bacterium]|nr:D-2-hydroxyacid dehydrogenase [Chloroflexota bacterium]
MRLRVVGPMGDDLIREIGQTIPEVEVTTGQSGPADADVDALVAWDARVEEIVAAVRSHPSPRWVHISAAGVHPALIEAVRRHGIILTNGSGAQAPALAEYVVLALLNFVKRMSALKSLQDRAEWSSDFTVSELRGKTIGLIGLGNVGLTTARLLRPFGVRLLGVRRGLEKPAEVDEIYPRQQLPQFLEQLDALVITAPLTAETRGMVGAEELARLKRGAYLVNIARGGILDENALVTALRSGQLSGAALDVFAEEPLPPTSSLWTCPNVVLSPHCCDRTPQTRERGFTLFLDNLGRFVRGDLLRNVVDLDLGY